MPNIGTVRAIDRSIFLLARLPIAKGADGQDFGGVRGSHTSVPSQVLTVGAKHDLRKARLLPKQPIYLMELGFRTMSILRTGASRTSILSPAVRPKIRREARYPLRLAVLAAGVVADEEVTFGSGANRIGYALRLITTHQPDSKTVRFIANPFDLEPYQIGSLWRKGWQIERFF